MRLSDAKSDAKPLEVPFSGGHVLNITYRVPEYTPNQAAALTASQRNDPRQAADMLCRFLSSWDLTDDDGKPYELVPEVVAENVPLSVINAIVGAINKDQMPGEAQATSDVG